MRTTIEHNTRTESWRAARREHVGAGPSYETADRRTIDPVIQRTLQRLKGPCERCRRAAPVSIRAGGPALCVHCNGSRPVAPGPDARTRALLAKNAAIRTEMARDSDARRIVGLVTPYEERTRISDGVDEIIHHGAFAGRTVKLTLGHTGPVVGEARTFEYRDGVYFEGTAAVRPSILPRAVSIGFSTLKERTEPTSDGRLVRHVDVGWIDHVALVPQGAYRSTWCAVASPDAYKRMTERVRGRLEAACV